MVTVTSAQPPHQESRHQERNGEVEQSLAELGMSSDEAPASRCLAQVLARLLGNRNECGCGHCDK